MAAGDGHDRAESVGGVVLAGGRGSRLGGVDKAGLDVEGHTLLDHVLAALEGIDPVVVVGERRPTARPVRFVREEPPGSGPAWGVLAGLAALGDTEAGAAGVDWVLVFAVDLPRVTPATVGRLLSGRRGDGARLVDRSGQPQHLLAVYRADALSLRRALGPGTSMHRLAAGLDLGEVPAVGDEEADLDTWSDVGRLGAGLHRTRPGTAQGLEP